MCEWAPSRVSRSNKLAFITYVIGCRRPYECTCVFRFRTPPVYDSVYVRWSRRGRSVCLRFIVHRSRSSLIHRIYSLNVARNVADCFFLHFVLNTNSYTHTHSKSTLWTSIHTHTLCLPDPPLIIHAGRRIAIAAIYLTCGDRRLRAKPHQARSPIIFKGLSCNCMCVCVCMLLGCAS